MNTEPVMTVREFLAFCDPKPSRRTLERLVIDLTPVGIRRSPGPNGGHPAALYLVSELNERHAEWVRGRRPFDKVRTADVN